jgi:pimeloyl-ACP methyl ester carboxylesterase
MTAILAPHSPHLSSMPLQSMVSSGDVNLAVKRWGDPRRTTIVLVHGYPDASDVWHPLAELLSGQFHVVAYDVRGAGDSDKPGPRSAYTLPLLMADFKAVIDDVSPDRPVHVVAHDWGSVQSWESVTEPAMKGRIASFTSCSGPCLDHLGYWYRDRLRHPTLKGLGQVALQTLKSWYVFMFQLPILPGLQWRLGLGWAWPTVVRLLEGLKVEARPTQVSDGVHGVQLYRANVFQRLISPRERHAHAPVQILVPRKDLYVSPGLTEDVGRWADIVWRREFDAGHWMPLSHPGEMAGAVRRFIRFVEKHQRPAAKRQSSGR